MFACGPRWAWDPPTIWAASLAADCPPPTLPRSTFSHPSHLSSFLALGEVITPSFCTYAQTSIYIFSTQTFKKKWRSFKTLSSSSFFFCVAGHAAGGGLLRCLSSSRRFDFLDRLLLVTAAPPLLACLILLCSLATPPLAALIAWTRLGSRFDMGPPAFARASASAWAWRSGCWVGLCLTWICLVEPAALALHFFACIRLPVSDGDQESLLLLRDLSVNCSSARYRAHRPLALTALALYPVGGRSMKSSFQFIFVLISPIISEQNHICAAVFI